MKQNVRFVSCRGIFILMDRGALGRPWRMDSVGLFNYSVEEVGVCKGVFAFRLFLAEVKENPEKFKGIDLSRYFNEKAMLYAFLKAKGKLPAFLFDKRPYEYTFSSQFHFLLYAVIENLRDWGSTFRKCHTDCLYYYTIDDMFDGCRIIKEDIEEFTKFFELTEPSLLFLEDLTRHVQFTFSPGLMTYVVAYYAILEYFDDLVEDEKLRKSYINPAFNNVKFENVSKEFINVFLKDKGIENLFSKIFKQLKYVESLNGRLLPKVYAGYYKNLFPLVKEKVEMDKAFGKYVYLESFENQPEEVKELKKKEININSLLEEDFLSKVCNLTETMFMDIFKNILLDIMLSLIIQELFEKYEFYHKKILTLVNAMETGDADALENNPNANWKEFREVGLILTKLNMYLGIYKEIKELKDFYSDDGFTFYEYGYTIPLDYYWELIRVMGDFEIQVEGYLPPPKELKRNGDRVEQVCGRLVGRSFKFDYEKIGAEKVLRGKIIRSNYFFGAHKEKAEYKFVWDIKEVSRKIEEKLDRESLLFQGFRNIKKGC